MAMATQQRLRAFSARRFIGKNVYDVTGDRVGEIDDLVVDMQSACAKFAIMGVGGFLGMGERHYIVPTQALSMNTETGALMLSVEKQRLTNAPTFDRDNPPDFGDEQWSRSIYTYYGMQYQQGGGQQRGWGMEQVGPGYAQPGGYGERPAPPTQGGGYGQEGYGPVRGQGFPGQEEGYTERETYPQGGQQGYGRREGGMGRRMGREQEQQQGYQQPIGPGERGQGMGGQGTGGQGQMGQPVGSRTGRGDEGYGPGGSGI